MKTDVYSWRVSRGRKAALEEVARTERTSVANVLDRATDEWIRSRQRSVGADDLEQARLRRAALRFVGALHGSDPDRSRQARVRVRAKLARRHAG
jgi:hypothetical protein